MISVRVPGKINIALRVGPAAGDGYHSLATVFQAVSLHERVDAEPANEIGVSVRGLHAELVPTDGRNLAVRAARLLADATGTAAGVRLRITKRVPTAGGMGGGSADGAAALVACDRLWGTGLSREELGELAAELGADVPFAIMGHTALGVGRGHLLSPVMTRGTFHWVLVLSDAGMSTPEVFREWDAHNPSPREPGPPTDLLEALVTGDARRLGRTLENDLEEASLRLRPELDQVLAAARGAGALAAIVSGSGPTVAALAADEQDARGIAARLREELSQGRLPGSRVLQLTGPAPGPRVLERIT